jgi:hypothetical protein
MQIKGLFSFETGQKLLDALMKSAEKPGEPVKKPK